MIYKLRTLIIAFGCFFGITLFFINSSTMTNFLGSFLHVDYSYTGGIVAGDFVDFNGDDEAGIVRYTVHQPVINARWQANADYWQVDFEFKNNPAVERNFMIFIALDNAEKKSWNYKLLIKGEKGAVYNSKGELLCETENCFLNDGKLLKLRIPLKNKELLKILGASKSYHYVVSGAASDELSKIAPREVDMKVELKNKDNKKDNEAYVQKVKELYYKKGMISNVSGDLETNLALYKSKIQENPDDYISLAYYGSCLAIKGGQAGVMKALALVNEAYTYLDKAVQLANGKDGEIDVLMNRAAVSASVPDQVFGKAESGAEDFMKIVSLTDDPTLKAYCYVMAYECYNNCGKESQAFLALQEAKKMVK